MAFDSKQLRTCKQLMKLTKPIRGLKSSASLVDKIFVRFGRFYVTNSYVVVSVNWKEYEHAGDEEWLILSRFMDNDGKLIPFEFEPCEMQRANDFFERHFLKHVDFSEYLPVNPKLLSSVLKVFEINELTPVMVQDGAKWELSAHNKDVSIKAIVMGIRR